MKKDIKSIIILVLVVILLLFGLFLIKNNKNNYQIKSLYIFGKKVDVNPNKRVFRVSMNKESIDNSFDWCTSNYYDIELTNGYKVVSGVYNVINDMKTAYFLLNVSNNNYSSSGKDISDVEYYDIYIEVFTDEPLENECSRR